ncbi:hypothetical protein ANN_21915, partial [Periplaneta americana]
VILRRFINISDYLASEWDEGDNAGEMSSGSSTESYPAFAHVGLRENPGKNLNQVTCPDRESNPGHLVSRPDALSLLHRCRLIDILEHNFISVAKRDEVTGEWRKLHNAELHALYSSSDIIRNIKSRRLRWVGHVARMGESRNAYRVLVGRTKGKRPFGRPRRRWEDNIKMDLREVGYDDRDLINLAQDRDHLQAYIFPTFIPTVRPISGNSIAKPRFLSPISLLRISSAVDVRVFDIAKNRDRWRAYVRAAMNLRVP